MKIEKRDDFDAMIERETISTQNIDFFDVAIDAINDCFDVTNEISENEFLTIVSEKLINDVNINVDSLDDENVAKNVNIVIIVFDVDFEIVVIVTNSLDIIIANFANFF